MPAEQETQKTQPVDVNLLLEPAPFDIDRFLQKKSERLEQIYTRVDTRERILQYLYKQAILTQKEKADGALVFGTSLGRFPDKFRKRVYWAAMLWHKGKVDYVVFAGKGDHETDDYNQALDARNIAVTELGVSPEAFLMAGGDNTQENAKEAIRLIPPGHEVFAVSENRHLIRGVTVARAVCATKGIAVYPNPVGGVQMLDANDPKVVLELIKAEGYNHTKYRFNRLLTTEELEYIGEESREMIRFYEFELGPFLTSEPEQPFQEWLEGLEADNKIQESRYVSN